MAWNHHAQALAHPVNILAHRHTSSGNYDAPPRIQRALHEQRALLKPAQRPSSLLCEGGRGGGDGGRLKKMDFSDASFSTVKYEYIHGPGIDEVLAMKSRRDIHYLLNDVNRVFVS